MTDRTQLWVRAEQRPSEERAGITAEGVKALIEAGIRVTVEESSVRSMGLGGYEEAGAEMAHENTWPEAPEDAIIFGLKELPEDGTPLRHRHIMFGHEFKGQISGQTLLKRFKAGGGTLYDLEYLVDENGRRVAAFGYWAGFAGAAIALKTWAAQQNGGLCAPVGAYPSKDAMLEDLAQNLGASTRPNAIIVGALGRVGTGASDLCSALGVEITKWDMAETAHGGPFPEILEHDIFLNCIFAQPGTPVLLPKSSLEAARRLSVVGDISSDPDSDYNPVPIYETTTTWDSPAIRVHEDPVMDVTSIDNLPSMLPVESSQDYAAQLLPSLLTLNDIHKGVWARAHEVFQHHIAQV